MNERPDVPIVVELDAARDVNPLILGLASMLAQRLIARAKARAALPPTPRSQ